VRFDRTDECYLPISILLDPDERDHLDKAIEGFAPASWEVAVDTYCVRHGLGAGLRAKLRVACYFWNGAIKLDWKDPRHLDHENAERFVLAMRAHLDLPHHARIVLVVPARETSSGSAG